MTADTLAFKEARTILSGYAPLLALISSASRIHTEIVPQKAVYPCLRIRLGDWDAWQATVPRESGFYPIEVSAHGEDCTSTSLSPIDEAVRNAFKSKVIETDGFRIAFSVAGGSSDSGTYSGKLYASRTVLVVASVGHLNPIEP